MIIEKRLEAIEKRLAILEDGRGLSNTVIDFDLTLPEADIGGLHFNEAKVHAIFVLKADGWWHSRDILSFSARNTQDDNSRDILSEYLGLDDGDKRITSKYVNSIRAQIADAVKDTLGLETIPDIGIALPKENEGVKKYNGVNWWYWLHDKESGSAATFAYVSYVGGTGNSYASGVGGCAPAFCIS